MKKKILKLVIIERGYCINKMSSNLCIYEYLESKK